MGAEFKYINDIPCSRINDYAFYVLVIFTHFMRGANNLRRHCIGLYILCVYQIVLMVRVSVKPRMCLLSAAL